MIIARPMAAVCCPEQIECIAACGAWACYNRDWARVSPGGIHFHVVLMIVFVGSDSVRWCLLGAGERRPCAGESCVYRGGAKGSLENGIATARLRYSTSVHEHLARQAPCLLTCKDINNLHYKHEGYPV